MTFLDSLLAEVREAASDCREEAIAISAGITDVYAAGERIANRLDALIAFLDRDPTQDQPEADPASGRPGGRPYEA